jgi:formylmethanofuran:tetrahydromethanopterin formyltransferase
MQYRINKSREETDKQLLERIEQFILTAPTTSVFNGLHEAEKQFNIGSKLTFFGDVWNQNPRLGVASI